METNQAKQEVNFNLLLSSLSKLDFILEEFFLSVKHQNCTLDKKMSQALPIFPI